ncbi:Uncharacterized protein QTN25_005655 [Entamoeba marina]
MQSYTDMVLVMKRTTQILKDINKEKNDDVLVQSLGVVGKIGYIPLPSLPIATIKQTLNVLFNWWQALNSILKQKHSQIIQTNIMAHLIKCVTYSCFRQLAKLLVSGKFVVFKQDFFLYKKLCNSTLSTLIHSFQFHNQYCYVYLLTYTELLVAIATTLPSLWKCLFSSYCKKITSSPLYTDIALLFLTDTIMKNILPIAYDLQTTLLFRGFLKVEYYNSNKFVLSAEYNELIDQYLSYHTIQWRSLQWKNPFIESCDTELIHSVPIEINSIVKLYAHNTNIYDVNKIIYSSEIIKQHFSVIIQIHPELFESEKINVDNLLVISRIAIHTDNAEALSNIILLFSSILPFLTGNSRKRVICDFFLGQHFTFFMIHWSQIVRSCFYSLLLFKLTLVKYFKLNDIQSLTDEEQMIYSKRNKNNYNALYFDLFVIKKMNQKIQLLEEVGKVMKPEDKQRIEIVNRLKEFFSKKRRI